MESRNARVIMKGSKRAFLGKPAVAVLFLSGLLLTGCVRGEVVDSNNYPIKDLEVTLNNMITGKIRTRVTDHKGQFQFFPVLNGDKYRLTASRYGYYDLDKTFLKTHDTQVIKDAILANRSRVAFHEFNPPALLDMAQVNPAISSRAFSVYMPPSYAIYSDRRYPVIYLLHGNTQNNTSYFLPYEYGLGLNVQSLMDELIAEGAAQEAIIVVPNGDLPYGWIEGDWRGSFYVNSVRNGDFETYTAVDMIDCIENNTDHCLWADSDQGYRVIASGASRAIHGVCMGTLGAMNIALRYPGRFAAVAGSFGLPSLNELVFAYEDDVTPLLVLYYLDQQVQGYIDDRYEMFSSAFDAEHFPDCQVPIYLDEEGDVIMTMVDNPFEPQGPPVELWSNFYLRYDPYTYLVEHPEVIEGLSFYLDCGDHDQMQLYDNNRAFSALLEDLGLEASQSLDAENRHFFEIYRNIFHVDHKSDERVKMALTFLANHLQGDENYVGP